MTQPQPETMPGPRPLDNLKILDFTHVLGRALCNPHPGRHGR